ncbi:hypothetical protein GNAINCEL_00125 [Serratia phage KKP 3709]|nr:hypothetical protein GNAINCEL_00125 [Serratia phage KKP 3709]
MKTNLLMVIAACLALSGCYKSAEQVSPAGNGIALEKLFDHDEAAPCTASKTGCIWCIGLTVAAERSTQPGDGKGNTRRHQEVTGG